MIRLSNKRDGFFEDPDEELMKKINEEIEKQLEEEMNNPKIPLSMEEEEEISVFNWIMICLIVFIVCLKLILLALSYMKLFK